MRKRIALLLGQADEDHQSRFISGFLEEAFAADLDVCIFSMYHKYQSTALREQGEANIFRLVNYRLFDALVLMLDTIQTPGVAARIEEEVHESFHGPVYCIDIESRYFPTIWTDAYAGVRRMIAHLIEEHGYTDIAYLTGKQWHTHAKERLQAYRDAMAEHGLSVSEDRVFYGDFWYSSGAVCAEQLLKDREHLPQAVACANDCMAIGLAEELEKAGVRVPEDVAVTGFDATEEGQTSPRPLTSVEMPSRQLGKSAAREIAAALGGAAERTPERVIPEIFHGESCGCSMAAQQTRRRREWRTALSGDGVLSPNNSMPDDMISQTDFQDFINTLNDYTYQLQPFASYDLCLNEQWLFPGQMTEGRLLQNGYSEQMLRVIHCTEEGQSAPGLRETFPTEQLLPELAAPGERPRAYAFTPVFFDAGCFGYSVISYGDRTRSYDEAYRIWIRAASRGLEVIRRVECLRQQGAGSGVESKFPESISGGKGSAREASLSEAEQEELREVRRLLDQNLFDYHFQPIVNAKTGEIYAYEALMRARTQQRISPLQIIRYADLDGRLADVEKATFLNVLHYLDQNGHAFAGRKVFLNSIPGTVLDGEAASRVDAELKRHADTAVVELTEQAELGDEALERLKAHYREMGIRTAVDDYGTGYSNIANLLRYMPQYVKIDRSLLSGIQDNPQKQHFVREIIEFSHDNDILALAEGVETTEELQMVIHLGADLIQGYYTARPSAEVIPEIPERQKNEILRYQQERQDGTEHRVYTAGKTARIQLNSIVRDRFTTIVAEGGEKIYRDFVLFGNPGKEAELHLEVRDAYHGRITLEGISLKNIKNRPCIDIAAGCEVTLVLAGDNVLRGGGIRVAKGARLTVEGDGNLEIHVNDAHYYGIGNADDAAFGELDFYQDGTVHIFGDGMCGIGIGGGTEGQIHINKGKYIIELDGDHGVGIGLYRGDVSPEINLCAVEMDLVVARGVGIGAFEGDARVQIRKSSVRCRIGGQANVALGTLHGRRAFLRIHEASIRADVRSDYSTVVGALEGETEFELEQGILRVDTGGKEALACGGYTGDAELRLLNSDMTVRVKNSTGIDMKVPEERIRIVNGRQSFVVNGWEVSHQVTDGAY